MCNLNVEAEFNTEEFTRMHGGMLSILLRCLYINNYNPLAKILFHHLGANDTIIW